MNDGSTTSVISTVRLLLEPINRHHAAAMFAGLSDARGYVYIPDTPPESIADLAADYAGLESGISPDGKEIWLNWVIKRLERYDFIGYVQATILCDEAALVIAYHIFPDFWGQGLGREAVAAMLSYCRAQFNVREARAYIDTRHTRSIRLVEALGFTRLTVLPRSDFFGGQVSDEIVYRLAWPGTKQSQDRDRD
jgi:[ribosomal protein S5]-alanine N-acetyltransferase